MKIQHLLSPVAPISVERFDKYLDQGESLTAKITGGGGEYKRVSYDEDIIHFHASGDSGKTTGDITIRGKNPGRTSVTISDKYGQKIRFGVTVKDTILRVSPSDHLILDGTDFQYINISESVGSLKKLVRSNDNVKAYYIRLPDGEQVVKVVPMKQGTTIIKMFDQEGNPATVTAYVGTEPTDDSTDTDNENTNDNTSDSLDDHPDNSNIDEDLEAEINNIFELLGIEINEDQTPEQGALAAKLSNTIIEKVDTILYDKIKRKLDPQSNTVVITTLNRFISRFEQKEYNGKKKTLADYIVVTFKIFRTERLYDDAIESSLMPTKKELIELERQLLANSLEFSRLKQQLVLIAGQEDGFNQAIEDYIAGHVELANLAEVSALMKGILNVDLEDIQNSASELYDIYQNIDEILAGLEPEKKAYYKIYLTTTLELSLIPVKLDKVNKFKGKGDSKVLGEIKDLRQAQNLAEKLALLEARSNLSMGEKVMDRNILGDPKLGGLYDKYRYVHRSQDGTNVTVHYHKHYKTGEVIDFKIKRN